MTTDRSAPADTAANRPSDRSANRPSDRPANGSTTRPEDLQTDQRPGTVSTENGAAHRIPTRDGAAERGTDERTVIPESTLDRDAIAKMVAADIPPGSYVNLGIGQPTLVADYLPAEAGIILHTENGMLGMGPAAHGAHIDPDLINAGKIPVTELPGACYFHHADSFAMMRGGHLDVCVLGAFQVSIDGDLANWHTGDPDAIPAVGGAMDLAIGAKKTLVMMSLFTRDGAAKLVARCDYPLTAPHCVARVYTDYGVFELDGGRARLREPFGATRGELAERLGFEV